MAASPGASASHYRLSGHGGAENGLTEAHHFISRPRSVIRLRRVGQTLRSSVHLETRRRPMNQIGPIEGVTHANGLKSFTPRRGGARNSVPAARARHIG